MHRWHVRVGHVRDEADSGGKEARVIFRPGDALREFGRELSAHGRDVHADLLEDLADHLSANPTATGLARHIGALPRRVDKRGIARRLALNLLEGGADAVAERLEPGARRLLLIVEVKHGRLNREEKSRMQGAE